MTWVIGLAIGGILLVAFWLWQRHAERRHLATLERILRDEFRKRDIKAETGSIYGSQAQRPPIAFRKRNGEG